MNKHTEKIKKRYNRIARIYDFMDKPMELILAKWRQELMKEVSGKVLEVGVGTGRNLKYYPEKVQVTAIDFSPRMIDEAQQKVKDLKQQFNLKVMDVQDMDFPDDCFDTVVTSCVFCSVPDPVQGLKEIRRVCKPGGKVIMLEHVRSNKPLLGPLMDILNPLPLHIYGANINRETVKNLKIAGFRHIEFRDLWLDIVKLFVIRNVKIQ